MDKKTVTTISYLSRLKIDNDKEEKIINDLGNEVLIYKTKKYGVPCERKFEVNAGGTIIAFSSSGCF